ncbi:endonuclease [Salix suchowensis]|nr:endonuclease [Salix suchowensis]
MGVSGLLWAVRVLVLLQSVTGILGWGKEGHYATCKIAEGYLTAEALAAVKELLPESAEGDLANVCSWPDEIRFHYHWSSALHYVDTPDFRCNYEYCRDCHDSSGRKDRCVSGAIYNYTSQLSSLYQNSISESNYNLTEALLFLSHFIGDVHQPLHVGFLGDLGGNTIQVRWYRRKSNLHHVWDNMIIESALKTFYSSDLATMIRAIQNNITGHNQYTCIFGLHPSLYSFQSSYFHMPQNTQFDTHFFNRIPVQTHMQIFRKIPMNFSMHFSLYIHEFPAHNT